MILVSYHRSMRRLPGRNYFLSHRRLIAHFQGRIPLVTGRFVESDIMASLGARLAQAFSLQIGIDLYAESPSRISAQQILNHHIG